MQQESFPFMNDRFHSHPVHKGRGSTTNLPGRFESRHTTPCYDDWEEGMEMPRAPETEFRVDHSRIIISTNDSEDISFNRSVNAYKGCEHGCIYCYARQTHAYLDLSPGLDFETKIYYKPNAVQLLKKELGKRGYRCEPIAMGTNTDPYQPGERKFRITRSMLEVLRDCRHPASIVTKGALIERDIDILTDMAAMNLIKVFVSLTTMNTGLKRLMEPRTASLQRRLKVIARMHEARIPVGAMIAPVIPGLTDHELESLMEVAHDAGAQFLGYILLRLPHEVRDVFVDWLQTHFPDRAAHIMSLVRQTRGGRDYDSRYGQRHTGTGLFADLIAQRFAVKRAKLGLDKPLPGLCITLFKPPGGEQLSLL